jgi:hypothetical protein
MNSAVFSQEEQNDQWCFGMMDFTVALFILMS